MGTDFFPLSFSFEGNLSFPCVFCTHSYARSSRFSSVTAEGDLACTTLDVLRKDFVEMAK